MELALHNTRTRRREVFTPLDPANVRLYLCGPTVYDLAHIGNARNTVVFDILVRLLRRLYPRVTYVRNITDIDDKINARATATGEPIADITSRTTADYHADMASVGNLPPDIEPRATAHLPEIIAIVQRLIAGGHAYEAEGHVLFSVASDPAYGKFSGRTPDELIAGARVEVAAYKRAAGDFVLWKSSPPELPGWGSPWGRGRPGWHIECSAMSWKHLGESFDIHGGGDDLIFPHHENEIAQSCCAFPGSSFAKVWVHNRMLLVDGEKMSKSLGNFLTIRDALAQADGEVLRFLLIRSHYRSSLDFTAAAVADAKKELDRFYRALRAHPGQTAAGYVPDSVMAPLLDDLNTPGAIAAMHVLANAALAGDADAAANLQAAGNLLGIFGKPADKWFAAPDMTEVNTLIRQRREARRGRDFGEADRLREKLKALGVRLSDGKDGSTSYEYDRDLYPDVAGAED